MEDFSGSFLKPKELDVNGKAKERIKLVDELDEKMSRNPNLLYWSSNNFIVAFHNYTRISNRFGIEITPSNLATFLETSLTKVLAHFQIELPDTFQYLEVNERKDPKSQASGYHHRGAKRAFLLKKWQHAGFSEVNAPDSESDLFYESAAHEAIGHGYIEPQVLPDWEKRDKKTVQFLREGLATYVQLLSIGVDPHDFMGDSLIDTAYLNLGFEINGEDGQLPQQVHTRRTGADIAIADVFRLVDREGKLPKSFLEYREYANYFMGASFIHFFVENFGMEKFKKWVKNIDSNNFLETLRSETGYSLKDIQDAWKKRVLEGSVIDNKIRAIATKDLSEDDKEFNQSNYVKIKGIFEQYA
jgi:hypothetical protein